MVRSPRGITGDYLDFAGRWCLQALDYRIYGLVIVLFVLLFLIWRRKRYGSLPSVEDCVTLAWNTLGVIGGVTVGIVFLLTRPPAIDVLPPTTLLLIGLLVPIVVIGYTLPRLLALVFPREAPRPPEMPTRRVKGK